MKTILKKIGATSFCFVPVVFNWLSGGRGLSILVTLGICIVVALAILYFWTPALPKEEFMDAKKVVEVLAIYRSFFELWEVSKTKQA